MSKKAQYDNTLQKSPPMHADKSPARLFEFSDSKDERKLYAANPFPGLFSSD